MTSMEDIKKELGEYLQESKLLKNKEEELEELITKATKVTTEISDMPKGSPKVEDKMAEYAAKIVDIKNEKYEQLINMYKAKKKVEDKIDKLQQPYKNILYYKYIKGYSLTEVAYQIGYDYDYTRRMHGIALVKYKNITQKVIE